MSVAEAPFLILDGQSQRCVLTKPEMSVGRSPENDIRLEKADVSRFHAQFSRQGSVIWLSDLGSANGTFVNGARVRGTIELHDGDEIKFAGVRMMFHAPEASSGAAVAEQMPVFSSSPPVVSGQPARAPEVPQAALEGANGDRVLLLKGETLVGRVPGNDLVLPDTFVSRQHAKIQSLGGQFILSDLGSSNGTFVNGRRLTEPHALQPGDEIFFGRIPFVFRAVTQGSAQGALAAFPVRHVTPQLGRVSILIENVVKSYQAGESQVPVLRGVSLQIQEGEFVSLVGPSGSGKSTLINMMTGIDYPDAGTVVVNGQKIGDLGENKLARWRGINVGLIFQFFQLLPTLTAVENVMLPMDFCNKYAGGQRRGRARECLALVGMDTFADRLPSALSGGQQQRVAIARALANDPPIIVGDEPTGNLDSETAQTIFNLLGQLAQQGKTVAIVTHDPLLARSTPRKIEILDGQIVEESAAGVPAQIAGGARVG